MGPTEKLLVSLLMSLNGKADSAAALLDKLLHS